MQGEPIDPDLLQRALVARISVLEAFNDQNVSGILKVFTAMFPGRAQPPTVAECLDEILVEVKRLGIGMNRGNGHAE